MSNYSRAQRQYDAQLPADDTYVECPECQGEGCVECDDTGQIVATEEHLLDEEARRADDLRQADIDREMGL